MDYEKILKNALNSKSTPFEVSVWIEEQFPELAESEDEKIRKAIHIYLDWLDGRKDYAPRGEYSIRDMISWLENQGEPVEINPSEFELQLNRLLVKFESLTKEELASSLGFYLNVVQNDGTYKDEGKQSEQEDLQKLFNIAKHQGYKEGLRDGRAEVWAQIEKQGEQKDFAPKYALETEGRADTST